MGCAAVPPAKCPECPECLAVRISRYMPIEEFKLVSGNEGSGKLYLLFGADWCKPCVDLYKRLNEARIDHGIIFLNVDETWAFILSRSFGVESTPAMAVVKGDELLVVRHDANKILVYLLAHLESK